MSQLKNKHECGNLELSIIFGDIDLSSSLLYVTNYSRSVSYVHENVLISEDSVRGLYSCYSYMYVTKH